MSRVYWSAGRGSFLFLLALFVIGGQFRPIDVTLNWVHVVR